MAGSRSEATDESDPYFRLSGDASRDSLGRLQEADQAQSQPQAQQRPARSRLSLQTPSHSHGSPSSPSSPSPQSASRSPARQEPPALYPIQSNVALPALPLEEIKRQEQPPRRSWSAAAKGNGAGSAIARRPSSFAGDDIVASASIPASTSKRPGQRQHAAESDDQARRQSRRSGVSFIDPPSELPRKRTGLGPPGSDPYDSGIKSTSIALTATRAAEANETLANYRDWVHKQRERQRRWTRRPYDHVHRLKKRAAAWYHTYIIEGLMRQRPLPPSVDGRHVPLDPGRARTTPLTDERTGKPYISNFIRSSRYTVWNFFPKQLIFQFGKLANFYFLIISILQMIPGLSSTGSYTTIIPLMFFVAISMAKEGYDDFRRYRLDCVENRSRAWVLDPGHTIRARYQQQQAKRRSWLRPWPRRRSRDDKDQMWSLFKKKADEETTLAAERLGKSASDDSNPAPGIRQQVTVVGGPSDLSLVREQATMDDEQSTLSKVNTRTTTPRQRMPWAAVEWQELRVGDIVRLRRDENVPADMIILHASGPNGIAYIETMVLDGETNLKTKQACQILSESCDSLAGMAASGAEIVSEDPNLDLYSYDGRVIAQGQAVPLTLNQIIFRGSVVRNTDEAIGLVINTGEECKIRMNAHKNKSAKAPAMQATVNRIVVLLVVFVVVLSLGCTLGNGLWISHYSHRAWYLYDANYPLGQVLVSFIIMFNTLIPLSLYISLEIIKVGQLILMQDVEMYDAETNTPMAANTTTILENLGQVDYIFSDKTGTLTENKMRFRKMSVAGTAWLHDMDIQRDADEKEKKIMKNLRLRRKGTGMSINLRKSLDLRRHHNGHSAQSPLPHSDIMLSPVAREPTRAASPRMRASERQFQSFDAPLLDAEDNDDNDGGKMPGSPSVPRRSTSTSQWRSTVQPLHDQPELKTEDLIQYIRHRPHTAFSRKARHFILCMALCHTCLPETTADGQIEFQSASPDELALVQAARDLGYLVVDRPAQAIKLQFRQLDGSPITETYQILDVVEFSSKRKRMSIVIRMPDGRICLFCKGADNVIMPRLKLNQMAFQKASAVERRASKRKSVEQELALRRRSIAASLVGAHGGVSTPRSSLNITRAASINLQFRGAPRRSTAKRSADFAAHRRSAVISGDVDEWLTRRERDDIDPDAGIVRRHSSTGNLHAAASHGPDANAQRRPSQDKIMAHTVDSLYDDPYSGMVNEALAVNEGAVFERCFQHIDDFASEGLRTLLFAYRYVEEDDYRKWKSIYQEATTSLTNRQERIEAAAELLEQGFDLAGVTAIEDKLQQGVPETIDKLRRANIKIWMLTGDKRETAINIAHSARICKPFSEIYVLDALVAQDGLRDKIASTLVDVGRGMIPHSVVVIDGHTLSVVEEEEEMRVLLFDLVARVDAVICCRASPSQKATLVKCIRQRVPSSMTLAIGDGANDIAMIQASHVGIGISGREGLQAARISDYSIAQFRFLQRLLLVHGRWNYIRTGKYILGTFWKEMVFYLVQAQYQRYNGYSGTSLYESTSLTVFNTLFTSLPVILLGIFEKDLRAETLLAVPELYTHGQRRMGFNFRKYVGWVLLAVCEAVIIFYVLYGCYVNALFTIDTTLIAMGSLAFTVCVVFINVKMLVLELHNQTIISALGLLISVSGWFLWNVLLSMIYAKKNGPYLVRQSFLHNFGRSATWWVTGIAALIAVIFLELVVNGLRRVLLPTDLDVMQVIEHYEGVRAVLKEHAAEDLEANATVIEMQGLDHETGRAASGRAVVGRKSTGGGGDVGGRASERVADGKRSMTVAISPVAASAKDAVHDVGQGTNDTSRSGSSSLPPPPMSPAVGRDNSGQIGSGQGSHQQSPDAAGVKGKAAASVKPYLRASSPVSLPTSPRSPRPLSLDVSGRRWLPLETSSPTAAALTESPVQVKSPQLP